MFYEMLKSRRSIRKFKDREVEKEKLDTILKSALLSPSSRALRPWEFIAVKDRDILKKLSESKEYGSAFLSGAPLGIVILADSEIDTWIEDSSIASVLIQLAAQSLGLGTCWIQIRERYHKGNITSGEYIKSILEIPEKYRVESIIAIGYPDEQKRQYSEDELLHNKIHINKF